MITKLEAINKIRYTLGFPLVSSLQTKNQTLLILQQILKEETKLTIRNNHDIFGFKTDLTPDINGQIRVSQYLKVDFPEYILSQVNVRNGIVYDLNTSLAYGNVISNVFVVVDDQFENISSENWQEFIIYSAAEKAYNSMSDIDGNVQYILAKKNELYVLARNEKINRGMYGGSY